MEALKWVDTKDQVDRESTDTVGKAMQRLVVRERWDDHAEVRKLYRFDDLLSPSVAPLPCYTVSRVVSREIYIIRLPFNEIWCR